ncbi:MAG: DUF423 domain-containing protein [Cytophagales bacterium]|nr:DUF423 domain-containing protein [Cytophagales bacterium]
MQTKWFKIAAISGALAVVLGAFGAHALKASLEASGSLDTYKTAVLYHFLHSLFILVISFSPFHSQKVISSISTLALVGIICFSGSLYGLTILKWTWFGPITPIGGLFFIAAWIYAAIKAKQ